MKKENKIEIRNLYFYYMFIVALISFIILLVTSCMPLSNEYTYHQPTVEVRHVYSNAYPYNYYVTRNYIYAYLPSRPPKTYTYNWVPIPEYPSRYCNKYDRTYNHGKPVNPNKKSFGNRKNKNFGRHR